MALYDNALQPNIGTTLPNLGYKAPETISPGIITSKSATTDLNNIKTDVTDINIGILAQTEKNKQTKLESDATAKLKAEQDAKTVAGKVAQDQKDEELKIKKDALTGGTDTTPTIPTDPTFIGQLNRDPKMIKSVVTNPDGTRTVYFTDGGGQVIAKDPNAPVAPISLGDEAINISKEREAEAQRVHDQILGIQNGTIPLSAGEQAQIDGLKQQFQELIDAQKLSNIGSEGLGNIRGYQTGSAEYDPTFQTKTIGSIITAGANKIASLNSKMASAVAALTRSFKDDDIEKIKSAYTVLDDARKSRQETIQKTIENTQKAIEEARKAKEDAEKTQYEEVGKPIQDLAKTAKQGGAPQEVIDAILASKDLASAYEASGDYSSGGTGIIGEYNYYKNQSESMGQTPLSFDAYQNQDANRKIKIASAANAAGLTTALTNTALKLSDDYEARSKDFYSQREAYNRVISSATDPSAAGDLALIFNYMKVLDPNSTVREGEFATAQNSGSAFQIVGAKYNKIVNGERLTEAQRNDFVNRVQKLFDGAKAQQDVVVGEFTDRSKKYGVPADLVIRDTSATGSKSNDLIKEESNAENKLNSYITTHPEKTAEINDKISKIEKSLGKHLSAVEFLQTYPEYQ